LLIARTARRSRKRIAARTVVGHDAVPIRSANNSVRRWPRNLPLGLLQVAVLRLMFPSDFLLGIEGCGKTATPCFLAVAHVERQCLRAAQGWQQAAARI